MALKALQGRKVPQVLMAHRGYQAQLGHQAIMAHKDPKAFRVLQDTMARRVYLVLLVIKVE